MAEDWQRVTLRVVNFRQPLNLQGKESLEVSLARELIFAPACVCGVEILNRSTDSRHGKVEFVYTLCVTVDVEKIQLESLLQQRNVDVFRKKDVSGPSVIKGGLKKRPVVAGCGPAGLFAAITLVQRGLKPIVVERGERISERFKSVSDFWNKGILNPESNVLFGEGGAGTFSDGKLTTRIKSPLKEKVLREFIEAGAPEEILYVSKPHLGTDRLRKIVPCIVEKLKQKGVDFKFNTKLTEIITENGSVTAVVAGGDSISTDLLFLATGHSARDMFRLLVNKGANLQPKAFAAGLRIEHPQQFINIHRRGFAGKDDSEVDSADYSFSYKDESSRRGVYTFCMCPGGLVVGCASSAEHLCVNGMSAYNRNSGWANSAVVVTVGVDDFPGSGVLRGVEFQEHLENENFILGGRNFSAPVQKAVEFVSGGGGGGLQFSYRPGIFQADLRGLLPEFIRGPLQRGLMNFNIKIPGFIEEGILTGVETRTSSPVRILRNPDNFNADGIKGLVPVGEGSGYAGGIVSSAVDAIKAAMNFDR